MLRYPGRAIEQFGGWRFVALYWRLEFSQMNQGAGHSAISCRNPPRGCGFVYYSLEGSRPLCGRAAGSNSVLETAKENGMVRIEAAVDVTG